MPPQSTCMHRAHWRPLVLPAGLLLVLTAGLLLMVGVSYRYTAASGSGALKSSVVFHQIESNWGSTSAAQAALGRHAEDLDMMIELASDMKESVQDMMKQTRTGHRVSQPTSSTCQQPPTAPWPPDSTAHHIGQASTTCDAWYRRHAPGLKIVKTARLVAPVVIVAYNRVHYLAKCMMILLRYWSEDAANAEKFPLFVSVDAGHQATMQYASALNYAADVQVIHNMRDSSRCKPDEGYCNLTQHYKMLLQLFFKCHNVSRLIFLEEDLQIAPDFFSYFEAMAPLLEKDQSLWCISAWNDHGQKGRAANSTALMRTDILPGLGWMLSAAVGLELYPQWPKAYWDDWMRQPDIRKGRQCVFPEVPRTHTFGSSGTSGGEFFKRHLSVMMLNDEKVDWRKKNTSYLDKKAYSQLMSTWLEEAEPIMVPTSRLAAFCAAEQPPDPNQQADMVVRYSNASEYKQLAVLLTPMLFDIKSCLPRASYNGTVVVRCRGRRLFITPNVPMPTLLKGCASTPSTNATAINATGPMTANMTAQTWDRNQSIKPNAHHKH